MSTVRKVQTTDELGLPQLVLIPDDSGLDVREGIPVHLDLDRLYAHLPVEFRRTLYAALWAQGLVEPCDWLKPGAADRYKAAVLSVIKHDFLSIQSVAKETCSNG